MVGGRKNPLTEYGISVRTKLIQLNRNPTWLCGEVSREGECFMDTQLLNKILTGKVLGTNKKPLINKILEEEEARQNGTKPLG